MAEHTKGPWAVIGDDEGFDGVPYYEIAVGTCGTSSFKLLAHVQATFDDAGDGSWDLTTEDEANAHLIAAAPDLLEAATDALAGWNYIRTAHGDLCGVAWDRVEQALSAAITKACIKEK